MDEIQPQDSEATVDAPGSVDDHRLPSENAVDITPPERGRKRNRIPVILGIIFALVLIASQVYLITTLSDTRSDVEALRRGLSDVDSSVSVLTWDLNELTTSVETQSAPATPVVPAGSLPMYEQGVPDGAVGLTLGPITGSDGYTSQMVTVNPADGTKRLWLVWAHWCPHCQAELPELSASYAELVSAYPTIEITTISSAIDPTRGNPLDEYLDDQQFLYPVIVDDDGTIGTQMGVSAFPFWVVTDEDGIVLFRVTGRLDADQLTGVLDSLRDYES